MLGWEFVCITNLALTDFLSPFLSSALQASLAAPKTLQQLQLPLIDTLACDAMYHIGAGISPSQREIQDDMICAGYAKGEKDACLVREDSWVCG